MKETTLCYIENNGSYLMLYRNKKQNDANAGKWIGIGGKLEKGETHRECAVREIKEELDTEVEVNDLLDTVEYDYPNFHVSMDCFICKVKAGDLVLKEHDSAMWLGKEDLYKVNWLPADQKVLKQVERVM